MTEFTFVQDIDVSLVCMECGKTLAADLDHKHNGEPIFSVEPCPDCLKNAKDQGYDEAQS